MWLVTTVGYFSVVQKKGTDFLTVRARVRDDLDNLRAFMPDLGPVTQSDYTDYEFRCTISHAGFAAGMVKLALAITYSNFKDEITRKQGWPRHDAYMRIWEAAQDGLEAISGRVNWAAQYASAKFGHWPVAKPVRESAWITHEGGVTVNLGVDKDVDEWWESMSDDERAIFIQQTSGDDGPEDERATQPLVLDDAEEWHGKDTGTSIEAGAHGTGRGRDFGNTWGKQNGRAARKNGKRPAKTTWER